jgi:hypothetical protein
MIAQGMRLYDGGNLNPWEWLIELLERGANDVDDGKMYYQEVRGDKQI